MSPVYDKIVSRADASGVIPGPEVANLVTATAEQSIALSLFRRVDMGTAQASVPFLSVLPDAYWVNGDTGLKQTTDVDFGGAVLTAEEIAVLVAVPDAVLDDASIDLWAQIRPELAQKFGAKIDKATIAGVERPATFSPALIPAATAAGSVVTAGAAAAEGGIAADLGDLFSAVEADGFDVTGLAANRPLRGLLRGARDAGGQPLADVATGFSSYEGVAFTFAPAGALGTALAVAGDFSCAVLGMRQDITYSLSSDGVITDDAGKVILNAYQQDSTILRAVMRVAFATVVPANDWATGGYPFAVLNPES